MTYTIKYPYRHPPQNVRGTGRFSFYLDLPNGSMFLMDGCVFEKLDAQNAGQLVPWDDEGYYEMDSNRRTRALVEVVEPV